MTEGYKLVPVDPDDAMIEAGAEALYDGEEWGRRPIPSEVWCAMIAAAPEPLREENDGWQNASWIIESLRESLETPINYAHVASSGVSLVKTASLRAALQFLETKVLP